MVVLLENRCVQHPPVYGRDGLAARWLGAPYVAAIHIVGLRAWATRSNIPRRPRVTTVVQSLPAQAERPAPPAAWGWRPWAASALRAFCRGRGWHAGWCLPCAA